MKKLAEVKESLDSLSKALSANQPVSRTEIILLSDAVNGLVGVVEELLTTGGISEPVEVRDGKNNPRS